MRLYGSIGKATVETNPAKELKTDPEEPEQV
jgi:hypothetical protein